MSYGETQLTMPVAPAGYGSYGGNGGIFGNSNDILGVLFLVALLNNNGNGNGLFGGGGNNGASDVQRGFDHSATITKLDGITTGLADLGYAVNGAVTTGFSNAELSAANRMTQLMQMLFNMQMEQQRCCCESKADIQGLRYDIATQSCDTRRAIEDSTRQISDLLVAQRIEAKDETIARQNQQIFQLQLAASQANQNTYFGATVDAAVAELYRRLAPPVPGPAWIVPNPNIPFNFGGFGSCGNPCGNCA